MYNPLTSFYPNPERWLIDVMENLGLTIALQKGISVCDVGCGQGRLLNWAALKYPNTHFTGIDVNFSRLADTNENLNYLDLDNITLLHRDVLTFQTTAPFDLIWFYVSLHTIRDPVAALKRALQWLSGTGHIIVVDIMDYLPSPPSSIFQDAGWPITNVRTFEKERVVVAHCSV